MMLQLLKKLLIIRDKIKKATIFGSLFTLYFFKILASKNIF